MCGYGKIESMCLSFLKKRIKNCVAPRGGFFCNQSFFASHPPDVISVLFLTEIQMKS